MAHWQVFPATDVVHQGRPHRMLELESDDPEAFAVLVEKALAKGWSEYVRGYRPDNPDMAVALLLKAA